MVNHIHTLEYPPNFAIIISRMWFNSPHLKGRNCDAAKLWLLLKISEHLHLICGENVLRPVIFTCFVSVLSTTESPGLSWGWKVLAACVKMSEPISHMHTVLKRIWRFSLCFPLVGFQQHTFTRYRAMSVYWLSCNSCISLSLPTQDLIFKTELVLDWLIFKRLLSMGVVNEIKMGQNVSSFDSPPPQPSKGHTSKCLKTCAEKNSACSRTYSQTEHICIFLTLGRVLNKTQILVWIIIWWQVTLQ